LSRRATRRGTRARPAAVDAPRANPPRIEIKGDPAFFRRINYRAVAIGFVVALAVYFVVGYLAQNFLVSASDSTSKANAVYASVSFLSMYCGGLAAGMIEPKYGVLNAPLVAVLFILIAFVLTFSNELQLVKQVGALGLGPMRVDRVFATDLPQLFFSSLGGLTAGLIERRFGRHAAR
jgi:hypothetical protein